MWKHAQNEQRWQQTYDEAQIFWRAREVYQVRRGIHSGVLACLFLEGLMIAGLGMWETALMVVGMQAVMIWGVAWLLRGVGQWARTWWQALVMVAMLSLTLSGCETMERGVAKLHGITVDPLPGPCAPESYQAKQCLAVKQESKP